MLVSNLDVSETNKDVRVQAELLGVSEQDISVSLRDDALIGRAEKQQEPLGVDASELSFGTFQRSLHLSLPVSQDQVQAQFENGLLTVTMPKAQPQERTRRIQGQGAQLQGHLQQVQGDASRQSMPPNQRHAVGVWQRRLRAALTGRRSWTAYPDGTTARSQAPGRWESSMSTSISERPTNGFTTQKEPRRQSQILCNVLGDLSHVSRRSYLDRSGLSGSVLKQFRTTVESGICTSGSAVFGAENGLGMAGQEAPETVDLADMVAALCEYERKRIPTWVDISLYVALQPLIVRIEVAALVFLATHELLRNAFTHAFPAGTGGNVGVHLWQTQRATLCAYLLIADDGCGFGAEPPATAASGLPRARRFLDTAGAQLTREPGNGTLWRVGLP